ncbi:MAG: hypothetical protein HYY20_02900 [Candidatus Tectomicrobia bacterium]|uniref:Uncharacterized protein n=1 Tax=Tectimicrobiota bacterium TaxID=2528274 RepID=A0A932CNB4_UNCTE|nr:hypothetical protein [Candidatus Tectomicrobia bacterium]
MAKEYHLIKGKGWGEMEQDPPEGEPVELQVRDADTFEEKRIRAILSRNAEQLPGGDLLWLYGRAGHKPEERPDNPWRIQVLGEILPDEEIVVEIKPAPKESLGRRGDLIRSLIRERQQS